MAALPAAHRCTAAAAARAAATARGRAATAASSTPALPPPDGPSGSQPGPRARSLRRRRLGRPWRLWEPAGGARAQGGIAEAPRRALVFTGRPARSPAPRGRPLAPGHGSERGRRVSTARSVQRLLPFPGEPSPSRECRATPTHTRVLQPWEGAEYGTQGASPPLLVPRCPSFGMERHGAPGWGRGAARLFTPCFASVRWGRDSGLPR